MYKPILNRHEIFPEFRNFPDLRDHSRGNPRSGLIFMGGGGGGYHILCVLADRQQCTLELISSLSTYFKYPGMRFFRNFLDLGGYSRGNPRSGLIFMGGGGDTIYCVCSLTVSNVGMARLISSLSTYFKYWPTTGSLQVSSVCFSSTCRLTSIT